MKAGDDGIEPTALRDFLVRVDSICSLVAYRGLDDESKRELADVSRVARHLYEAVPREPDLIEDEVSTALETAAADLVDARAEALEARARLQVLVRQAHGEGRSIRSLALETGLDRVQIRRILAAD